VESSGVQWGTVESYRNRGGRVKPSIYYISNVVVHKFCVFNIVNIICFTGPAEGLHYNIVFQHILCIRNTVNVVLRLSSRGVQFIFSGPVAGLTNRVPVRDFDPGAPLGSHTKNSLR